MAAVTAPRAIGGIVLLILICLNEATHEFEVNGDGFEMQESESHSYAHEDQEARSVSTTLSLTLFGTVAWIMFLFYFVNSKDEDIVKETWRSLTAMISIFVAVLFFNASRDITIDFMGEMTGEEHGPVNAHSRVISVIRLAFFSALVKVLMFVLRYNEQEWQPLRVVGNVGSHVVGFALIEVFGCCLMSEFGSHLGLAFLGVLLALMVLGFFHAVSYLWRKCVAHPKRVKEEAVWREVCLEQECESASLALGLLISMVTRLAISGNMPPIHGSPWHHSQKEVWLLFASSIGYGVLLLIASFFGEVARTYLEDHRHKMWGATVYKATDLFEQVMSMSMGWCLLWWGQWLLWNLTENKGIGSGSHMTARLILALAFSLLAFVGIYVIDCFADAATSRSQKRRHHDGVRGDSWWSLARSMRKQIMMLGLLMGLSWEDAFTAGSQIIAHHFEGHLRLAVDAAISLVICVVVLPAWALYIFPKSLEEEPPEDECKGQECDGYTSETGLTSDESLTSESGE